MTAVHDQGPVETGEAEEQTQLRDEQVASRQGAGTRAGARTREATMVALRWVREVLGTRAPAAVSRWWSHEKTAREAAAPDPRRSSIWSQAPASPADLWAYTTSGAWVPGDRATVLEAIGKAYGCFAVAASVALYALAWVLQRPTRLIAVAVFLLALRLSWGA